MILLASGFSSPYSRQLEPTVHADRFSRDFQRVQRYEGFNENYRAQTQDDIDNFVRYIGPAINHPPYLSPQPTDPQTGMPIQAASTPQSGLHPAPGSSTVHASMPQPQHQSFGGPGAMQQQSQQSQQQQLPWLQQLPGQQQQQQQTSNIVPFQRKSKANAGTQEGAPGSIPGRFLHDDGSNQDSRPILLFDLNGTLTSHTAARHSSGKTLIRPGTHHLRRLQASLACAAAGSKTCCQQLCCQLAFTSYVCNTMPTETSNVALPLCMPY